MFQVDGICDSAIIIIVTERAVFIVISNMIINKLAFAVVHQFKKDMSLMSQSTELYKMQKKAFHSSSPAGWQIPESNNNFHIADFLSHYNHLHSSCD